MTSAEIIILVTAEMKGLSSYLVANDYSNACSDAERDTGWSLPITDGFKILWFKERVKRYLFFYLLTESAHKFKFKQINLQHRFEHYRDIVKYMDEKFLAIMEERPDQFAGVEPYKMFGHKVDAGFAYNPQTGDELTYKDGQLVIFEPTDS